jgi:hypothetical protein
MYVAKIPNHGSSPTYLLRESYREDDKIKSRTVGNITSLGIEKIARIALILKRFPIRLKKSVTNLDLIMLRLLVIAEC